MNTRRSQEVSRNRRAGFQYLSIALGALLAFQPVALAAPLNLYAGVALPAPAGFTYVVNRTGDAAGVGPAFQGCDTDPLTPGSQCTLRAALRVANLVAGEDTITFNIPMTESGCDTATGRCTITLTQALPDITEGVAIEGPGADKLTVRRSSAGGTPNFRVFNVTTGGTVTFSSLTISGGQVVGNGGGIQNGNTAFVTIANSIITANLALGSGGGVSNAGAGTVNIANSTISGNRSSGLTFSAGGGVLNSGIGTVNITDSTITANLVSSQSSGLNSRPEGGGIANVGTGIVNVTTSTIRNNSAVNIEGIALGGGISNGSGTMTVTSSAVSQNFAQGGPFGAFGGGMVEPSAR